METNRSKNNKNGLIQSQELLYTKLKRINQLFKLHFSSLTLLMSFALGFIILWTYLLATGQATTDIAQRYGLFGTIVTIILTIILFLVIIQIGIQAIFYGLFIFRGNCALNQAKRDKETKNLLYSGIVPYITNFYAFFNRYSKENTTLIKLVSMFLLFNFISGLYVIILFPIFLDAENGNPIINAFMVILFLGITFFWIMNLITSNKIKKEIVKWESLFPKLDEWAQDLEQYNLEDSNLINKEEST